MHEQNDLVTVIIPVYNVERYLGECVNSVRRQTYQQLEIILVNDGSNDQSGRICDELAAQDQRIKVFHLENRGVSNARNFGLDVASGDYVCFLDSDDWLYDNHVEKLYSKLQEYDADIAIAHHCAFRGSDSTFLFYTRDYFEKLYSRAEMIAAYPEQRLLDGSFISPWGKLYKRQLFDKVRYPLGRVAEDAFTTYKLYLQAENIIYLNEPLYYYRLRGDSISHTWNEKWFADLLAGAEEQMAVLATAGYDLAPYSRYYKFLLEYCRDSAATQGLQNTETYRQIEEKLFLLG